MKNMEMIEMFKELSNLFGIKVLKIENDNVAPDTHYKIDVQKYDSDVYVTYNTKKEIFNDKYEILDFVLFIKKTLV